MRKQSLVLLIIFGLVLGFQPVLAAKPEQANPAGDLERGVFVHYPHVKGQGGGGGGSATGDQVNDFKYSGVHWAGAMPDIHYSINPQNSQISDADVINATQAAFKTWMDSDAKDSNYITFTNDGATGIDTPANPSADGVNTVSFEPLDVLYPHAIAVTFYWYSRGTKALTETDTIFNSDLPWSVNGDPQRYDLQNIATHEFGHWLLLGDLYSWRDSALTMYGYGGLGETEKQTLGKGDISGINRIY